MKKIWRKRLKNCTAIMAAAMLFSSLAYPIAAFAIESITLPVQVLENDVVSISVPTVSEGEASVFDFIMDPQGLLYATDAARYGGGRVEEGATLLFHNNEGEYNFSGHSDWLTITNCSTVPVYVSVKAQVNDLGDIGLAESADFEGSTEPKIYLAIEDNEGNIQPLSANEQSAVSFEMSAVPKNAYAYRLDEETQTYQYEMIMDSQMINFDTYSFRLIGKCNSAADWQYVYGSPALTVTWCVEPVISEQLETEETEKTEETEETAETEETSEQEETETSEQEEFATQKETETGGQEELPEQEEAETGKQEETPEQEETEIGEQEASTEQKETETDRQEEMSGQEETETSKQEASSEHGKPEANETEESSAQEKTEINKQKESLPQGETETVES